jgi:NAD(P)-dependent dehydrogenase (short-subunit alcohol dehydrogenase family)
VDYLLADLSVQAQVRQLAADFKARYKRLDVLVNDAGAIFLRRQLSTDGIEMNFALNHLAYFLLTNLLLDTLKASAPARVVNVRANALKLRETSQYLEQVAVIPASQETLAPNASLA